MPTSTRAVVAREARGGNLHVDDLKRCDRRVLVMLESGNGQREFECPKSPVRSREDGLIRCADGPCTTAIRCSRFTPVTRIGFADHLFLRMHHGIGFPIYNQFVWRFDRPIPRDELEAMRTALSHGLLARRVRRAVVVSARDRWVRSSACHSLDFATTPIEPHEVRAWSQSVISPNIDPETGKGWQLSAAPLSDGGTVVSLACSHMIADGGGLIQAVRNSRRELSQSVPPQPVPPQPILESSDGPAAVVIDDLADAWQQWRSVVGWTARAVRTLVTSNSGSAADNSSDRRTPSRSIVEPVDGDWTPPYAVAEFDAEQWHRTARTWGGTSNSLFVAVLTAASAAAGRAHVGDRVTWSLPVSDRRPDDTRSNATKIVKIDVRVAEESDLDLTDLRRASKAAFTAFSEARAAGRPPAGPPQALVQMLPDAVVARVPAPRDGAEGLASNLGVLPEDFLTIAGVRARAVSARATFLGVDADYARSLDGGLTAWITDTGGRDAGDRSTGDRSTGAGGTVTVCAHGMDPDRFPDDRTLTDLITAAGQRWGLRSRSW